MSHLSPRNKAVKSAGICHGSPPLFPVRGFSVASSFISCYSEANGYRLQGSSGVDLYLKKYVHQYRTTTNAPDNNFGEGVKSGMQDCQVVL